MLALVREGFLQQVMGAALLQVSCRLQFGTPEHGLTEIRAPWILF